MTPIVSLGSDVLVWQIAGISIGMHYLGVLLSWGIPGVLSSSTTSPWTFSLCSGLWLSPPLESDAGIVLPVEKEDGTGMAGEGQTCCVWNWEQGQWDSGTAGQQDSRTMAQHPPGAWAAGSAGLAPGWALGARQRLPVDALAPGLFTQVLL